MPGPFAHIYTARQVAAFLGSAQVNANFIRPSDGTLTPEQQLDRAHLSPKECADAMNKWPKFTAVGAIGPDIFFFLEDYNQKLIPSDEIMLAMSLLYYLDDQGRLDDPYDGLITILAEVIGDTWANILRFIVQLDKLWKGFVKKFNELIGPILDKAGQIIDDLAGGLFTALGDAFTQLKNGLVALVEEELLTEGDIFGWFSLKMRKGYDEQAFLWSDMTHYRRTSVVPAQLISRAQEMLKDETTMEHGEQLLAFALGWVVHVGTDVVGHSFVNEQCGGPFRTHWQRHHLIENHIDAWNYQCTKDGAVLPQDDFVGWQPSYRSLGNSALYFALQIPQNIDQTNPPLTYEEKQGAVRQPLPEGTDSTTEQKRKDLLDTDGALPPWLAEVIVEVFIAVYADPSEGGDGPLQATLKEDPTPHPRNLQGQQFSTDLKSDQSKIAKWLQLLGIDNVGMALEDLRKIIAPDPAFTVPVGFPFPWQVMTAYRFMLSWFKRQYVSTLDIDRPEPPNIFTPPLSDLTDFGPPDFSGVSSSDDPISEVCGAVLALIDWVFKSLEAAGQLLYDLGKSVLSAGTYPARLLIYEGVTLPLWEATENIRMVLVHLGYMQPGSLEFYDDGNLKRPNEIDEVLITLGHSVDSAFQEALAAAFDPLGNLDKDPALTNVPLRDVLNDPNYPWLPVRVVTGETAPFISKLRNDDCVEYQRPWAYPDKTNSHDPQKLGNFLELPLTTAGPYPVGTMPHSILGTSATNRVSNSARKLYTYAQCPDETDSISKAFVLHQGTNKYDEGRYIGTNPLGDPVIFSSYLMGQISNNSQFVSSFNLDADRGYGYLCWDWIRVPDNPDDQPKFGKDEHDNVYQLPDVPPEGTDGWLRPDAKPVGPNQYDRTGPLELHYSGRKCPPADDGNGGNVPR
jgi:hypothetical protein